MKPIKNYYPQRIVCLTDEATEALYLLGEQERIVGISSFCTRPRRAIDEKPKVATFAGSRIDKIVALNPDLVIGYSDIQATIAKELVSVGIPVWINNHRNVEGICKFIAQLGAMVGKSAEGIALTEKLCSEMDAITKENRGKAHKPIVYFEEWNQPIITGICWVGELIELAGGIDMYVDKRDFSLAKDRVVADSDEIVKRNPDIILASWCGKKFDKNELIHRQNWKKINAVKNDFVFEIDGSIILQPGPAAISDGIAELSKIIEQWHDAR